MKRATPVGLLLIIVLAAWLALNKIGLFQESTPAPPAAQPPASVQPSQPQKPETKIGAPPMRISRSSRPVSGKNERALSHGGIAKILDDWTYPGAAEASNAFARPGSTTQKAKQGSKYIRSLVAYGPPANVWRFYEAKAGVVPSPQNSGSQGIGSLSRNPGMSDAMTSSVAGINTARYSKSTNGFSVSVFLFYQNGTDHTQISLEISPRTMSPPSSRSGSRQNHAHS